RSAPGEGEHRRASSCRTPRRLTRTFGRPSHAGVGHPRIMGFLDRNSRTGITMTTATSTIQELANREYQHGFVTDIESESVPMGLKEEIIRIISAKKHEPGWLLEWRLKAFRHWQTMEEPRWWPKLQIGTIDYQNIIYYSAPKPKKKLNSLEEVDPELRRTF